MGCCVSSNTNKASTSSLELDPQPIKPNGTSFHFQVEEEKVKQVLSSETPKWNPKTTTKEEKSEKKTSCITKANDTSQVCNISKTMLTTTKQETRKRVNRSPVILHKNRSFSGDIVGRREKTVHATSRNSGSVRFIQCRDQAGQRMVNGAMRRRRDPGDKSFRYSPATHLDTPVMGRSASARRTNRSSPVVKDKATPLEEKIRRKTDIPATVGKRSYTSNESLENPLVSLECFIFI